jgi:hypothetical protein
VPNPTNAATGCSNVPREVVFIRMNIALLQLTRHPVLDVVRPLDDMVKAVVIAFTKGIWKGLSIGKDCLK